jgi:predicted transcriptional regulator
MLLHMKQVLIQIDDEVAKRLEQVAPARSRQRSDFIRMAIRKALWEREEHATAAAYRRQPDSAAEAYVDPRTWEPGARRRRGRRRG